MVKISFGGYDDGEGSSNPTQKRRRVEEEEDEDDQQPQQGFEMEDPPIGSQEQEHNNNNSGNEETAESNGNPGQRHNRARPVSVVFTDPDVLDCFICYEPLTVPVFQCENGHVACSTCCVRLRNKCPLCLMPIGYNRCRAMEKLLESITLSCCNAKYGCKEMISYSVKSHHENECIYVPCLCPHTGCSFVASAKELYLHFSHRHVGSGIQFAYDKFISVFINTDQKAIVLQEQNDAGLFIVHNNPESLGNMVHISCIGPKSMAGFHYDVLARSQGTTLILQSCTKIFQGYPAGAPSTGFLLIPSDYFGSRQLKLDIRIKSQH